ncbi:VapB-type antitoxin [Sulfuracidifex metallicus]|uniref:VapB-type antitoxin n=1 Tax=Sulfuracidifex metallicus DSM 6482 = JCM 9184 TaxID=523847 RepID=A0A6A9QVK8_SULME|nr:VapB-type antitoxin [Sulfuracidifex metallicus]MUN29793.1 VapB-type antitoxin [Sulfuracidifex metallicus DSM 6482 = JCM 9184]WOE51825.1 VapB-type antitoxin [Sulfuracidifex metallicus DSM 6482 = JCM 9184]
MPTISFRINNDLKKKMDELSYINWSEIIRMKIEEVIEEEERKKGRKKDLRRIKEASIKSYEYFSNYGGKKSEETIREWRDRNWQ